MAGKYSVEAIFTAKDRTHIGVLSAQRRFERFRRVASRSMSAVNSAADSLAGGMRKVASAATAATVAAAAAGASIIKEGAGFEQAITNVAAVGLQTREEIAKLEKKALDLGASTKFTATQAAEGMELMRKAGFSVEDTMVGIDGVLSAAAASGLGLAEVSNHVSNVMKGMGLETSQATKVADVLALASTRTNSEIGSLGESMKNVAGTARQFQIPLEETVASVALLQDAGLDASVAGSAMNTMLTQLAKPTGEVAAKLKELGVKFEDAQGNALPFKQILQNLSKGAAESGGNMRRVAFFADLVGLRGQKAATFLSALSESGQFDELVASLQDAEGAAKKMAEIRMQTVAGQFELLKSAISGVQIEIFQSKESALRGLVEGAVAWVGDNREEIVKAVNDAAAAVEKWISANKELLKSKMKDFITGFADAVKWTVENIEDIVKWTKILVITWATFKGVAATLWAINTAMGAYALVTQAATAANVAMNTTRIGSFFAAMIGPLQMNIGLLGLQAKAAWASAGGFWGMLGPILLVVAALAAANEAIQGLLKQTKGLEGLFAGIKKVYTSGSFATGFGALDAFTKGVDKNLNERARANAARGDQSAAFKKNTYGTFSLFQSGGLMDRAMPSAAMAQKGVGELGQGNFAFGSAPTANAGIIPQNVPTQTLQEQVEILIRDTTGQAEVTKAPKGKTTLKMQRSGAL